MSSSLHKVLQLCERQCFLWPVVISKDSNNFVEYFKFGFAGELLKNNICQEWLLSMVMNTDENIFPYHSHGFTRNIIKDLREPFEYVKKLSNSQLPFGISETRLEVRDLLSNMTQEETRYFQPQKHTVLWSCIFARPGNAMQRFYQWQRQRKMWWRKFSASPGRFFLTDIQSGPDGQLVEIKAEFPWGSETVETVCYSGVRLFENIESTEKELFEVHCTVQEIF
ncbi:DNA polymerase subunit gamma-2, mitochondrial [Zootermopsis nevadensis]|uniref:DNA polymerase subunit gamma-2, mitochondrial n=1 Tax=Zootermopsis nevadensis TaxID=136037 RepID=A0A067QMA6_ZOONE|nr:DNA polymerase subunit gamma-2, mitochondrial [Zootermopsis nevadensis]